MKKLAQSVCATTALALLSSAVWADEVGRAQVHFVVEPQALREALNQWAEQAGLSVIWPAGQVEALAITPRVAGELRAEQALQMLLEGSGLTYSFVDSRTVAIHAQKERLTKRIAWANDESRHLAGIERERVARLGEADVGGQTLRAGPTTHREESKKEELEEVVVTGSRLVRNTLDGPQEVSVYTSDTIARSGQTTLAEFLNTLPSASVALPNNTFNVSSGYAGTVQLHGLPVGTTLVLINGRRVNSSGISAGSSTGASYFDLNTIPLAAIERIEVLAQGSSAIYGSDAVAGVVNIILKRAFDGIEISARYGFADDADDWNASLAWGAHGARASATLIATAQAGSELMGFERERTANGDFTRFGGIDSRFPICNPGNVYSLTGNPLPGAPDGVDGSFAAVSPAASGNVSSFEGTYGVQNRCTTEGYQSLIPQRRQQGMLAHGDFQISDKTLLFAELLLSHTESRQGGLPPFLFGDIGFQVFTVSAENPFNPFGESVGVSYLLTDLGRNINSLETDFWRPLLGIQGSLGTNWSWEATAWSSADRFEQVGRIANDSAIQDALNATTTAQALNPFSAVAAGSPQLLQSLVSNVRLRNRAKTDAVSALMRGPFMQLPAGDAQLAIGAEYDRNEVWSQDNDAPGVQFDREISSIFGEARVPVLASRDSNRSGELLALTIAARFDDYSDFGSETTPQWGIELRPTDGLLVRGAYAKTFRAPSLNHLHASGFQSDTFVLDPLLNDEFVPVSVQSGSGSPDLHPETGTSQMFGFVYVHEADSNLRLAATHWHIELSHSIQLLEAQLIADNEALFPGRVVRGPSQGGGPGAIVSIDAGYVNFGDLSVEGIDYQINFTKSTSIGELSPSLTATQTYHYTAALVPGAAPVDGTSKAQNSNLWAPRWKGALAFEWARGATSAALTGRYVGSYQDYERTDEIGNFWLLDASFQYALGESLEVKNPFVRGLRLSIGGSNILDRQPQYSNVASGFVGYDYAQADIRGRYLYTQLSARF